MSGRVILTADDYAISPGVSAGIRTLAAEGRLSATSAMTTMAGWPAEAARLVPLRARIAVGLHLDLTAWRPLGAMPSLAPDGRFPPLSDVLKAGFVGRLAGEEIGAEIERQLDAFERAMGFAPDHVDGHQHVHAVPGVREPLIAILKRRYGASAPLMRVPRVRTGVLPALGATGLKAAFVAGLAVGLARSAQAAGVPVNDAFAGFSAFRQGAPFEQEIDAAMRDVEKQGARLGIVMCHPGHPDHELAEKDAVLGRRQEEFDALLAMPGLPDRIWRAEGRRSPVSAAIDWAGEAAA